jgi:AcrR family transcriptional regulator
MIDRQQQVRYLSHIGFNLVRQHYLQINVLKGRQKMSKKKDDRRVQYTKMVIKESLINLLSEKPLSKITVKELCFNAGINRATFYSHYRDIYDLMNKIQDELLANVESYLDLVNFDHPDSTLPFQAMEQVFEYIKDNAKLTTHLLGKDGDFDFQRRVFTLAYNKISGDFGKTINNIDDTEYLHTFIITGAVGAIRKWLNDEMVQSPKYMAKLVINLAFGIPTLAFK